MCLQLIADELVAKFQWIGQKLGIKKNVDSDPQEMDEKAVVPHSRETRL